MKLRPFAAIVILGLLLTLLIVPSTAAPPPPEPPFDPVDVVLNAARAVQAAPSLEGAPSKEGGRIDVAAGGDDEITPAVAYSTQSQQYLVVYESPCTLGASNYASCICGTYVAADGQVLGSTCLKSRANNRNPDVAYDPNHNRFGVVWESY